MTDRPPINRFRCETAQRLRASQTNAEVRLWRHLRRLVVRGTHFRRQVPIGPYVADFACMAARLVIEVDGSQHGEATNLLRDAARTRWLESQGYRVLRFWNNDISRNIEGVLETIRLEIDAVAGSQADRIKHRRRRRLRVEAQR